MKDRLKIILAAGATLLTALPIKAMRGGTPLHGAANSGSLERARDLLEKGADINAQNNNGNTPLHVAVWSSDPAMVVTRLIEKGADINAQDNNGLTPQYQAAMLRNLKMVMLLLEKGADKEAQNNDGNTPLHVATHSGNEAMATLLLHNGADIEAQNNDGNTPLHVATHSGNETMATLLLQKGADIEAQDNKGYRPLHEAADRTKTWNRPRAIACARALLAEGAELTEDEPLVTSAWQSRQPQRSLQAQRTPRPTGRQAADQSSIYQPTIAFFSRGTIAPHHDAVDVD